MSPIMVGSAWIWNMSEIHSTQTQNLLQKSGRMEEARWMMFARRALRIDDERGEKFWNEEVEWERHRRNDDCEVWSDRRTNDERQWTRIGCGEFWHADKKSKVLAEAEQANLTPVSILAACCCQGSAAPLPASRVLPVLTLPATLLSKSAPVRLSRMVGRRLRHAPATLNQSLALCPQTSRLQMGVTPSGHFAIFPSFSNARLLLTFIMGFWLDIDSSLHSLSWSFNFPFAYHHALSPC